MTIGPFASDVTLVNITFPSEVLSVGDCIVRGFKVQEHKSHNSSFKVITLQVPFTDRVVLQMVSSTWEMDIVWGVFFAANLTLYFPTERSGDYGLLSSPDLWLAGPAGVLSIFSHCLSGS